MKTSDEHLVLCRTSHLFICTNSTFFIIYLHANDLGVCVLVVMCFVFNLFLLTAGTQD